MLGRALPVVAFALVAAFGTPASAAQKETAVATFAGGCFWCMEPPFDKLEGVESTMPGYTGGHVENPSYEEVSAGGTGHAESMKITYNPEKIDFQKLLHVYWRNVDPFDGDGQFCDQGSSYRPEIFYQNPEQKRLAEETRAKLQKRFDKEIKVKITKAEEFYPAEKYHRNYYKKNSIQYKFYKTLCGRHDRLVTVWGDEAGG